MSLKTRGSESLDKAQRRLALLKSIDTNLDLGHGLTVAAYILKIEESRAKLEAHNILLSDLQESRSALTQLDRDLAELSERMLTGVSTKYGRNSIEYAKAGGTTRKRSSKAIAPKPESALITETTAPPIGPAIIGSHNSQPLQAIHN
jgi:hypothetical protein